ncbi:MAG: RelA/SpoT domain-containing protein [Tissierellales bacterium]|nr:RelA/SpoT domain-containing protein [Tissierellales bacterium]
MIENKNSIDEVINFYNKKENQFELEMFLNQISTFFSKHPILNNPEKPIVHSIKSRLKDSDHLKDKIDRKGKNHEIINVENLFDKINDLAGVRILHIHQEQFIEIHKVIMDKVEEVKDWKLVEEPKAFTWDPESKEFYEKLGIKTELKETYYTSVHYVIKPNNEATKTTCEIQVRTLFEEVWGEISHSINYPKETSSIACKEQLRVLSRLVSTGTRLVDSIFKCYNEK